MLLILCAGTISAQQNLIDSLTRTISLQRHDTVELEALLKLSNEYIRKDLSKAKELSLKTVAQSNAPEHVKFRSAAYNYLITVYQQSGNSDSALYYLSQSEKLVNQYPDNFKLRFNYNQTAGLFYKNAGALKKALPFMLENTRIWTKEDEHKAGQLLNLGNLYFNMGDYRQAGEAHLQSLSLFEKLNNKRGQSFCLQGLGGDFIELRQFEKAKVYFTRSLQLKKELQDKRGIITACTGLGDVYKEYKQYAVAEKYYNRALKEAQQMKLMPEEARCFYQLSLLYQQMGEVEKTHYTIKQALKLARQAGDSTMSARINGNLIALRFEEQQEKAIEQGLTSNLTTVINSGDRSGEVLEYLRLSDYYASRNQYDKAFLYLQKHEALKDSVEGSEVLLQMRNLEEQYQNDKNEKEIEILKKDQELQALALGRERTNVILIAIALISVVIISVLLVNRYRIMNRAARELEIEKVRNNIARDLHDDIGSTLSSINILSRVALVEQNGNTQNYLQRIGDQSTRMMEDMSDMVWSINPRNDSMEKVITRMREFATEILESSGIEYRFSEKIDNDLILDSEKRKNLFLIFKEAINNAAKYSKANRIEIGFYQQDDMLTLTVKDNGQGFDEQKVNMGNGLRNLRERAKEINGSITLDSAENKGTELVLQLPLA